jgi:hypothetical protein
MAHGERGQAEAQRRCTRYIKGMCSSVYVSGASGDVFGSPVAEV